MNKRIVRALCLSLSLISANRISADVVTDWNQVASDVLLVNTSLQNPGMASRSMAMLNLAMYDAVNGIAPTHQAFYSHTPAPSGASPEAAAMQSAYRVLSTIYPDQQATLDAARTASLNALPGGASHTLGIAYGETVAANVLNARNGDGYMNMVSYMPQGGAGSWEPDPLNPGQQAWGPEWGEISTFAVNVGQMVPPAPPELTTQQYANAFNEVKALGAKTGSSRTAEQTEIGIFWAYDRLGMGTPMRMYNAILRTVADQQAMTCPRTLVYSPWPQPPWLTQESWLGTRSFNLIIGVRFPVFAERTKMVIRKQ